MDHFYYLILDLLTIAYPLARSFEPRVKFARFFPGVFLGIAVMCMLFIPWDVWFTSKSIWGFNEKYISGIYIANLPIEEWLFFIAVPFACAFIYEVLNYFLPYSPLKPIQDKITSALILISFVLSVLFVDRLYTFTTFSLLCLLLIWHLLINRSDYLGQFFLAFVIIQIPFLLVNGALTGLFTEEPIVWYNNAENLNLRILTIPVDDIGYNMLMLLIVITILEQYKVRKFSGVLTVS
ncbi:MAG: lycopene cyclase domain-containing protein [Bacteroidota bacterium]